MEIRLTHPAPYFPTIASTWVFHPVKRELVERGGAEWAFDPANRVGNGPFRVSAIETEGSSPRIDFVANERYWAGRPKLDGIAYLYGYASGEEQLAAYQRGELDVLYPYVQLLPTIEADPTLRQELLRYPAAGTITLAMNLNQEPFQDKQVREAFSYAFDRDAFCTEIFAGVCVPTVSWIPPGVPGAIETDQYGFDPVKARQALAASSYGSPENLPEVRFFHSDTVLYQRAAEWLANQYREVLGIEITLVPTADDELFALFREETWPQLAFGGWYQDYPDPQNWLSIYWSCGSTIYAGNVGYCNPEFDALVDAADAEADPNRRLALYEEAGRLLADDVPSPPLYHNANVVLVKPHVVGYITTPGDQWPGWVTPLTIDLAPAAENASAATPET